MTKAITDNQHLSPEARKWLDRKIEHVRRTVVTRSLRIATQRNDDLVLPSHLDEAWNEISPPSSRNSASLSQSPWV